MFDCLLSTISSCLAFDPLDRPSAADLCNEEPFLTTRAHLLKRFPHIFKNTPSSLSAISPEEGCDRVRDEGSSLDALKQAIIDNSLVRVRRYMDTFDLHASQMMELGIEHKSYLVLPMLCRRIVERNLCVSVKKRKGEVVAERTNLMKAAWTGTQKESRSTCTRPESSGMMTQRLCAQQEEGTCTALSFFSARWGSRTQE